MKKIVIAVIGVLIIVAGAYIGVSYYVGNAVIGANIGNNEATQKPETDKKDSVVTKSDEKKDSNISDEMVEDISTGDLERIKSKASLTDKIRAGSIVLKNLSSADIQEIKDMSKDGVTPEEKAKIKDKIETKFPQKDIDELKSMYDKYK